jgi:hypothetical protein
MRTVAVVVSLALVAGCKGHAGTPDSGYEWPQPPDCTEHWSLTLTCIGDQASGTLVGYTSSGTAHCPSGGMETWSATCAQGCAVQGSLEVESGGTGPEPPWIHDPGLLCAERASTKVGDPCTDECWPTRADLAADGTVTGQTYLVCDSTTMTCREWPGPGGWLPSPCDSSLSSQLPPGTTGYRIPVASTQACLVAWDSTNQPVTASTSQCIGDWQCPTSTLCDDHLVDLDDATQVHGVCKPGPKGVLTPAMLSP